MFNPTQEQINVNTAIANGENVIVEAGAGAAKSTTLRYLAQMQPEKNFLTICFNKANAEESESHPERPSNMYYSTIHSIAYAAIIGRDRHMRAKLSPFFKHEEIPSDPIVNKGLVNGARTAKEERTFVLLIKKTMLECITAYCQSDSKNLESFACEKYHAWFSTTIRTEIDKDGMVVPKESVILTGEQQLALAKLTREHWLRLIDIDNKCVFTHDVYLKLFHLRDYKILSYSDKKSKEDVFINVLCLDEAQDSNPVTVAIFKNSNIAQKIVVGDEMQQLYRWRGAGDAMNDFAHYTRCTLSTSFRFGNNIADMANTVLAIANSTLRITGSGKRKETVSYAHLCRTNAALINYAFTFAQHNTDKKLYVNADLKDLFNKMYHLNSVHFDETPRYPHKSLLHIMSKAALEDAIIVSQDIEALAKLTSKLATNYGGLSAGIAKLKEVVTDNPHDTNYSVSTIHKSKGLEWDFVSLDNDFIKAKRDSDSVDAYDMGEPKVDVQAAFMENPDLLNMLYVAITRARVQFVLPDYLADYLNDL